MDVEYAKKKEGVRDEPDKVHSQQIEDDVSFTDIRLAWDVPGEGTVTGTRSERLVDSGRTGGQDEGEDAEPEPGQRCPRSQVGLTERLENGWTRFWRRGRAIAYNIRKDSVYRN